MVVKSSYLWQLQQTNQQIEFQPIYKSSRQTQNVYAPPEDRAIRHGQKPSQRQVIRWQYQGTLHIHGLS